MEDIDCDILNIKKNKINDLEKFIKICYKSDLDKPQQVPHIRAKTSYLKNVPLVYVQPAAQQVERVQCGEYVWYVLSRKVFQPAAQQLGRFKCDEYELYVWRRKLLQPAAQWLERVQSDEY